MLRILIADDHEIIRTGLKMILADSFPAAHLEEAEDTHSLISKAEEGHWDIILSDLAMPGGGGLHALEQLSPKQPRIPVLIVSMHSEDQYALQVMKAGAAGYLNKDSIHEELINAVQVVLSGGRYIPEKIAEQL